MYCYHYKLLPLNFDNYFCQGISIHNVYNTLQGIPGNIGIFQLVQKSCSFQ